jgi:Cu/Ag efflux pump CusA
MKNYKVRIYGMGIEAVAKIPFQNEPSAQEIEDAVAIYLSENQMEYIELDTNFYSKKRYTITYEEIQE